MVSSEIKQDLVPVHPVDIAHVEENSPIDKIPDTAYTLQSTDSPPKKSSFERRLVLKQDLIILPLVSLLYFVTFLDRNSYGNARLLGLQEDLGLTTKQYGDGAQLFFVGYILLMLPGNIFLRWISPNLLIGASALLFGAFLAAMAAARTYGAVLALRILVGLGQSLVQGSGVYTSLWYTRRELATRAGVYYSTATISGAFTGLIAYAIGNNLTRADTGRAPWEWLFIIEGAIAVAVGILIVVLLPPFPDKIKKRHWLFSEKEVHFAVERSSTFNTRGAKASWSQIRYTLMDPKTWAFALITGAFGQSVSTVGVFLPSFIAKFGFSHLQAQLFSVIPYSVAFVMILFLSFLSDRVNCKAPFILTCQCCGIIGYILLLSAKGASVKVVATCFVLGGVYPGVLLSSVWLGINSAGFSKRATTWALSEMTAQAFSIMGTGMYKEDASYTRGHWLCLAFLVLGMILVSSLLSWYAYSNRKRDRILTEYAARDEVHPHAMRSLEEEYDAHINFRYTL